jgi:hypothetical protein
MATKSITNSYVEDIALAQEMEHRIALATVRIGEVQIRGIAVWRSKNGKLSVFFPSYKLGSVWVDAICVPDELRSEIEADVIAAYKEAKTAAKKEEGKRSSPRPTAKLGRVPHVEFPFENPLS